MNTNMQKINWLLDALLFAGFLVCFFLDLTGVTVHQWLGVLLGVLLIVHFLNHADWIKAVLSRFFGRTSGRSRLYAITDFLILLGFVMMLETGLVISTWFNLNLENYMAWRNLHVYLSVGTLVMVVVKIGFHWRWIVNIAKKIFNPQPTIKLPQTAPAGMQPAVVPVRNVSRRDFLLTMGVVGLGSALAIKHVLASEELVQAASENLTAQSSSVLPTNTTAAVASESTTVPTTVSTTASTATAVPTATAYTPTQVVINESSSNTVCQVQCHNRCSYPGRCHRYTDSNSNGKCDFGECA